MAKTYVVTFHSHNDDRPSKFTVLADKRTSNRGRVPASPIRSFCRGAGPFATPSLPIWKPFSIHHSTVKPQQLLKNDGTVESCCIVESVRISQPGDAEDNASFNDGTRYLTVRSFLSANAIRSTDSMDGIDECSSNNSTPCALKEITVPILIVSSGGHYFNRDNEFTMKSLRAPIKNLLLPRGLLTQVDAVSRVNHFLGSMRIQQ